MVVLKSKEVKWNNGANTFLYSQGINKFIFHFYTVQVAVPGFPPSGKLPVEDIKDLGRSGIW
jgi:hypothetical protein